MMFVDGKAVLFSCCVAVVLLLTAQGRGCDADDHRDKRSDDFGSVQAVLDTQAQRMSMLEADLQSTKAELQSTKAAQQSTNVELQSTKAELQSTTAAQQSTNVELQSTKAELQSTTAAQQSTSVELQSTKAELQSTKAEMQSTKAELQSTTAAQQSINLELQSTKAELQSTTAAQQSTNLELQSTKADLQSTKAAQQSTNVELQSTKAELQYTKAAQQSTNVELQSTKASLGSSFVRWGRSTCPVLNGTRLLYSGFAGSTDAHKVGGGANRLCLTKEPVFDGTTGLPYDSLTGMQYHVPGHEFTDVPCAVCHSLQSVTYMVPGTNRCPAGSVRQYDGWLTAGNPIDASSSEFLCLDAAPEDLPNTQQFLNESGYFLQVKTQCGVLPCPPYAEAKIVLCVVCSV